MFQTAYQQVTPAERVFVDRLVSEMVEAAKRHGRRVDDLIGAPLPPDLRRHDPRGWLDRPLVVAAVTERLRELQLREDISLDAIVRELHAVAKFNLKDVTKYDSMGDPYFDLEGATPDQWAAIESIEIEKSDSLTRSSKSKIKIKTHSKLVAAKMLLDLLGGSEAENPYRRAAQSGRTPQLTDQTTAAQAADEYSRMIGDE